MTYLTPVKDVAAFQRNAQKYFEDHYATCETYWKEKQSLNVDVKLIQQLIDTNVMHLFCIYDDSKFIGYITVAFCPSIVLGDTQATTEILYILPEYREMDYATKAIKIVESDLKEVGITMYNLLLPTKDYTPKFAESLSYEKTSTIYSKCLED